MAGATRAPGRMTIRSTVPSVVAGNPADLLRDQRPGAAHLPEQRAALHRVQIDRVAIDARRRRFQPRDACRDDDDHDGRNHGIQSLAKLLPACEIGSGDVHSSLPPVTPAASSFREPLTYRLSIGYLSNVNRWKRRTARGSTRAARPAGTQAALNGEDDSGSAAPRPAARCRRAGRGGTGRSQRREQPEQALPIGRGRTSLVRDRGRSRRCRRQPPPCQRDADLRTAREHRVPLCSRSIQILQQARRLRVDPPAAAPADVVFRAGAAKRSATSLCRD